jgi:hypothetical protein
MSGSLLIIFTLAEKNQVNISEAFVFASSGLFLCDFFSSGIWILKNILRGFCYKSSCSLNGEIYGWRRSYKTLRTLQNKDIQDHNKWDEPMQDLLLNHSVNQSSLINSLLKEY